MIKTLESITELTFPVASCKKYKKLGSTRSLLTFGDIQLVNHGNLFNTLKLSLDELPETYVTFPTPETFIKDCKLIENYVLLDDKLNIFIPRGKVNVLCESRHMLQLNQKKQYLLVEDIPYYLPLARLKAGKYPVIAYVNGLYFHIDWSDKREYYELFI